MTEVGLFMVMGFIAIASAGGMLLTRNAVHSALFLILNFTCVAFLYLMLNAPFLAMVQIAVYAGAIMVLFLFAIMLLGAERATGGTIRQFRWFTPVALFLSVIFLLAAGWALVSGQIDLTPPVGGTPLLRVSHAAPDSVAMDVYVDGEMIAENVNFREASDLVALPTGEHTVALTPTGRGPEAVIASIPVTLESVAGQGAIAYTVVAYGEGLQPMLAVAEEDLSTVPRRQGRVNVFNAFAGVPAVTVYDLGPNRELDVDATTGAITDVALSGAMALGDVSEAVTLDEGPATLGFVGGTDDLLYRIRSLDIPRDSSQLIVFTGERLFDDSLRPLALPLVSNTVPSFGGPKSVGEALFTTYLLPFEMLGLLLLVAMVGAIVLTHDEDYVPRYRSLLRRKVSRPLTSVIAAQTGHAVVTSDEQPAAVAEPEEAAPEESPMPEEQPEPVMGD